MQGVIRLSNMIELLPPPLQKVGSASLGGVACSRDGEQLSVT